MRKIQIQYVVIGISLLGFLWLNLSSGSVVIAAKWSSEFRPYGASVDEIEFIVFTEGETAQAMLALEEGDVDAYDDRVDWDFLILLVNNPEVQVTFTPSVRYRALTLNCDRFPTNITAFRRAMAFGMDKYRANTECIQGVGLPLDSYFPIAAKEWEVENQLTEHFYEADFESGNRSLENAGFSDLDGDGWREYDRNRNGDWDPGVDLDDDEYADGGIIEMLATAGYEPAIKACEIMHDGLVQMGIRSSIWDYSFQPYPYPDIEDFLINCWTEGVPFVNIPRILYDNFRTGARWNKDPNNYYHFSNSTIDAVLDKMVNSTSLTDVKKYAIEAAKLLAFEQPQIVCYNDVNIGAYRNDKFEGWFEFAGGGWSNGDNWACATKVHLKENLGGPWGGAFRYCLSDNMGTLNPYLQKTGYEKTVFQYIYERLWNIDPITWDPIPGLAYDWEIERIPASGDIRDGQKFTFYLYENETWHDGEAFTAADVNHSVYMWRDSPYHRPEMEDIYKIELPEGPEGHTIAFYVNETGYFEWADTTQFYITPEHIWCNVENVTFFPPKISEVIGTGPYRIVTRVPGENISLLRHDDWRWALHDNPSPSTIISENILTKMTSEEAVSKTVVISTPTFIKSSGFTPFFLVISILGILWVSRKRRS